MLNFLYSAIILLLYQESFLLMDFIERSYCTFTNSIIYLHQGIIDVDIVIIFLM